MNTLIKIIITTVIGFFGPLTEVEDIQLNVQEQMRQNIQINKYEINGIGYCRFNEKSCKTLKNKFDS